MRLILVLAIVGLAAVLGDARPAQAEDCADVMDYSSLTRCLAKGGAPAAGEEAPPMPPASLKLDPCLLLVDQEVLLSVEPQPGWRPAVRTVYFIEMYKGEVLNGSMHQFFFNYSGGYAAEIIAALREVGVPGQAELVEEGVAMFPQPYIADTDLRRSRYFSASEPTALEDQLYSLTDRFDDGAIAEAEFAYAKREKTMPACPGQE